MSRIEDSLIAGLCPDCNHRGFVFDWGDGDSRNIECASLQCRSRFRLIGYAGPDHFLAFRMLKRSEGGPVWPCDPPEDRN